LGAGGRRFESCHPDKKLNSNVRLFLCHFFFKL
jgi:hypothetical protein